MSSSDHTDMAQCAPADVLTALTEVLRARQQADPDASYVARLLAAGSETIGKKIGEEATELAMAGVQNQAQAIVSETADVWFHTLVLLVHHGLDADAVLAELARRFGVSGIEEKAQRAPRS